MSTTKAKKKAAKATSKKPSAKKPSAKKASAKKATSKPSAKKATAKKPTATKATSKPSAKKATAKKASAKKPAPKRAAAKAKAAPKKKAPSATRSTPLRREDRPGHLDAAYAESLRALSGSETDDDRAFVEGGHANDDLAEELGEEAVVGMTTGEDELGDDLQAEVDEEQGGPFVRSNAGAEFADDVDASNPVDAEREPFPRT
jgi:hypothetical protein